MLKAVTLNIIIHGEPSEDGMGQDPDNIGNTLHRWVTYGNMVSAVKCAILCFLPILARTTPIH